MKTLLLHIALATAVVLCGGRQAWCQPAPGPRADLAGTIGWLVVNKEAPGEPRDDNWHSSLFGAASAGWYWTENLKTELDAGAGTANRVFRTQAVTVAGRQGYASTDTRFSRRTLGISQQYQFFHNAWFHPHLAVGVNVTQERFTRRTQQFFIYDVNSRTSEVQPPATTDGPRSEITVRPFVATGFKAYMTRRAFCRGDFRAALRGGIDEVLFRFGVGVDF